jgi:hypothetical protein
MAPKVAFALPRPTATLVGGGELSAVFPPIAGTPWMDTVGARTCWEPMPKEA